MRMPQSLKTLENKISKFINRVGEAICYLCGIAAVLSIMVPAGYLVSLISAPTISIIIVACVTPLLFGSYGEIFNTGYSFPKTVYDFLTAPFVNLKNRFKRDVLGVAIRPTEPTNPFHHNDDDQNSRMDFITYAKSWCPAFICGKRDNSTARRSPNYGGDLEEESNNTPRLSAGGYKI